MGTDFYFRQGHSHSVCQDYAIAGTHKETQFACLSDGCSGLVNPSLIGSPNTDFGARFLVRAAIDYLNSPLIAKGQLPTFDIIHRAWSMAHIMGLHHESLDATLLLAVRDQKGVRVYQTGDGVVAARKRTGEIRYFNRQFGNNAPFYLSYLLQPEGVIDRYLKNIEIVIRNEGTIDQLGGHQVNKNTLQATISDLVETHYFPEEEYEVVLLMSDGAESFQDANKAAIPLNQILEHMFAFKGLLGEFLTRRCNFFEKHCQKNSWRHYDDFSVVGITL